MAKKKKPRECSPCEFMRRRGVPATHGYNCELSGEKVLCCASCYQTYKSVIERVGPLVAEFKGVTNGQG